MVILTVQDISKSFAKTQALQHISFNVDLGEVVALLGPSGCGKSTLLAIIAGLELPDGGDVLWDGLSLAETPPHLRDFGLMFQDFALFPHMNVYANIAFGLKMAHLRAEVIDQHVNEMLRLVELPDFSNRDINTLSGGEQQRVALARALAPRPKLLMLDEPLGSLDRNLREQLVAELRRILHQMHQTAIYVTHDQEEAFTIADRIILMNAGKIEQIGTPIEMYGNPASVFAARFLELNNIIPGIINQQNGKGQVITDLGNFSVTSRLSGEVDVLIRPDVFRIDSQGPITLRGVLLDITFRGSTQRITIGINHIRLTLEFPFSSTLPSVGSEFSLSFNPNTAMKLFPKT